MRVFWYFDNVKKEAHTLQDPTGTKTVAWVEDYKPEYKGKPWQKVDYDEEKFEPQIPETGVFALKDKEKEKKNKEDADKAEQDGLKVKKDALKTKLGLTVQEMDDLLNVSKNLNE